MLQFSKAIIIIKPTFTGFHLEICALTPGQDKNSYCLDRDFPLSPGETVTGKCFDVARTFLDNPAAYAAIAADDKGTEPVAPASYIIQRRSVGIGNIEDFERLDSTDFESAKVEFADMVREWLCTTDGIAHHREGDNERPFGWKGSGYYNEEGQPVLLDNEAITRYHDGNYEYCIAEIVK